MTIEDFNRKTAENPLIVCYFSHDECNVCKVLKPQVRAIVEEFDQAYFMYVNTKESPEVGGQFMVFAVPTIILFYEGREAKRYSRHISLQDFRAFLERMTGNE
jgi:thioredoxin-like negative regulator of GroEL